METSTQEGFKLTVELKKKIDQIFPLYVTKRAVLLPVLNLLQEKFGFVSPEMERVVARYLDLPLMQVREVVSFYTLYQAQAKGRYHFQICRNMSCTLCGCEEILDYLKGRLGLEVGQTSPDGRFSLSTAECLGACEMAPMMQVNEKYIGHLTKEAIDTILSKLDGGQ